MTTPALGEIRSASCSTTQGSLRAPSFATVQPPEHFGATASSGRHEIPRGLDLILGVYNLVSNKRDVVIGYALEPTSIKPQDVRVPELGVSCEINHPD